MAVRSFVYADLFGAIFFLISKPFAQQHSHAYIALAWGFGREKRRSIPGRRVQYIGIPLTRQPGQKREKRSKKRKKERPRQ